MGILRPEDKEQINIKRIYPATTKLSSKQREDFKKLSGGYVQFIEKGVVSSFVVNEVIKLAQAKGYTNERSAEKPFYILGPDEKSFALVRPGELNQDNPENLLERGLKIISSHVDSPCLIARQRPLFLECNEEKELYPGAMFDMVAYGGILNYQWENTPVLLIGEGIIKGKRYEKILEGVVMGHSVHLDQRPEDTTLSEIVSMENLKVFTGHSSREEILKALGLNSEDDFFTTSWYAVPNIPPKQLKNNFIYAYGHDDRAGTFAAVDALLRSGKARTTNVVIGFDYEETGSDGAGGAKSSHFLEEILETIIETFKSKLTSNQLLRLSQGISADVTLAPGPHENSEKGYYDKRNISRLGYGAAICSPAGLYENNNLPLDYKHHIVEITKKRKIRCQYLGSENQADNAVGPETVGYHLTNRGLYSIDVGPPISCSHGTLELLHLGDLFWTQQFYKAFFEHNKPYQNIKKER